MKLLISVLLALATVGANASNWYVSTSGTNSASCGASASTPCATVSYVNSNKTLRPGDVVHIAAGAYSDQPELSQSGSSAGNIVWQGEDGTFDGAQDCAMLAANQQATSGSTCPKFVQEFDVLGNYVTVTGLEIEATSSYDGLYSQGEYNLVMWNWIHDITISGRCGSGGGGGIDLYGEMRGYSGAYQVALGNYVYNEGSNCTSAGDGYYHGIYMSCPYCAAYNNIVFDNRFGWGIQAFNSASPGNVVDDIVANNTVFNNLEGGIVYGSDVSSGNGGRRGSGSSGNTGLGGAVFYNNIVANNGGPAFTETCGASGSCGSGDVYAYNDMWGNTGGNFALISGADSGNNQADTNCSAFVDYTGLSTGNYHILDTSAAYGYGAGTDAYATDFDGNARPQSGRYDIGAYEYVSSGTTPPSTAPAIDSFTASPASIASGSSSTLSWVTTGAASLAISPGSFTSTAAGGSTSVSPAATNTYTLTAANCGSSVSATAQVTVTPAAPPPSSGVIVTSPISGTVTSPFTLKAAATTCSGQTVVSMGWSLNSGRTTTFRAQSINTSITAAAGSYTLHVTASGSRGASCVTNVAITVSK